MKDCRLLVRGDLPAVTRMFNEGIDAGELSTDVADRTEDAMASWLLTPAPQFEAYVVDEGEGPIAWAALTRHHEREAYSPTAELSLYVARDRRRQGLGLALGEHMVERARSRSFHSLVALLLPGLSSLAGPPQALRTAKKLSFVELGSLRGVYPRGVDCLDVTLLQRTLHPQPGRP
jgi:L-amino acid N-acyltransferase YncA